MKNLFNKNYQECVTSEERTGFSQAIDKGLIGRASRVIGIASESITSSRKTPTICFRFTAWSFNDSVAVAASSTNKAFCCVTLACPTALAHTFVLPHVPDFLERHPGLVLDLQINDRYVNLVDEGAELAIRIGHLEDSALRARRIGLFKRVCVASKKYLAKRGIPLVPDDLRDHDCVIYTLLSSGTTWGFQDKEVPVSGRFRVNSPDAVRESVNAGLGIGQGPEWLFEEGLKNGNLKLLLQDYAAPLVPIQIIYVANRLLPKRATVFMDFFADALSSIPALNRDSGSLRI